MAEIKGPEVLVQNGHEMTNNQLSFNYLTTILYWSTVQKILSVYSIETITVVGLVFLRIVHISSSTIKYVDKFWTV